MTTPTNANDKALAHIAEAEAKSSWGAPLGRTDTWAKMLAGQQKPKPDKPGGCKGCGKAAGIPPGLVPSWTPEQVRQAIYNADFRALFPEYVGEFEKFLTDPGCPCKQTLPRKLYKHPDRLVQWFNSKN